MEKIFNACFPGRTSIVEKTHEFTTYHIEFPDGYGRITQYQVLPGIALMLNDFHTHSHFMEKQRYPGLIEVNHCLHGRFECRLPNGRIANLCPQDFAVTDMGSAPHESMFPLGEYLGISLILDLKKASDSIDTMMESREVDLKGTIHRLFSEDQLLLLKTNPKIQHIFAELYNVPDSYRIAYFKLKVVELFLFLKEYTLPSMDPPALYLDPHVTARIQEIEHSMTKDLRVHYPLDVLAAQYEISLTVLKRNFKKVYGESPYSYLKRKRMAEAALLLATTAKTVAEIAEMVGYQNAGKFSKAFAAVHGMPPSEYKKTVRLDHHAPFGTR